MNQSMKKRDVFFLGLTLFSLFFGAGNLIFPPFLGAQAGTDTWISMIGFAITAIGFPVLGVVAVAKVGGFEKLAGKVGRRFASVFILLVYLSIGPGLAIPRTASTSFEMAILPFAENPAGWVLPVYSLAFFIIGALVAFRPEKLTDRIGKLLAPCLLTLILVIVIGCLVRAPGGYGAPTGAYAENGMAQGFADGYQTMDALVALNYGIIITLNIRSCRITDRKKIVHYAITAGWIAGGLLLAVYCALAHIGAVSGGVFPGAANGANVLTNLVSWMYGPAGSIILGLIFVIACLNVCIGLLSSCSEYFHRIAPRLPYRAWVLITAAVSYLISIAGLDMILKVSTPILHALYPMALVLIVLGLANGWTGRLPLCYPVAIAFTGGISILYSLDTAGLNIPLLSGWIRALPLYGSGLCWLIPAVIGAAVGAIASMVRNRRALGTLLLPAQAQSPEEADPPAD